MLFTDHLDFLLWVYVFGTNKKLVFSAAEPASPAILTGTQVEFGTSVATAGNGGRICS